MLQEIEEIAWIVGRPPENSKQLTHKQSTGIKHGTINTAFQTNRLSESLNLSDIMLSRYFAPPTGCKQSKLQPEWRLLWLKCFRVSAITRNSQRCRPYMFVNDSCRKIVYQWVSMYAKFNFTDWDMYTEKSHMHQTFNWPLTVPTCCFSSIAFWHISSKSLDSLTNLTESEVR